MCRWRSGFSFHPFRSAFRAGHGWKGHWLRGDQPGHQFLTGHFQTEDGHTGILFNAGIAAMFKAKTFCPHRDGGYNYQVGTPESAGNVIQRIKAGHHFLNLNGFPVFADRMWFKVQVQYLTDMQEIACAAV